MNEENAVEEYDIIVIGGGPAGSSTAGLLALRGHRVLVLEREKFPRYHIGESLITGVLAVADELEIRDRLEAMGFIHKHGGTLVWGKQKQKWAFSFIEGGPYPYSYQVRRADFDALLLTRARELGARVIEEATVRETVVEDGRVTGVRYTVRGLDQPRQARARLVVDASGQARVIGRQYAEVSWHDDLRNVAVWAYFQDCQRLDGDEAGNILVENVPGGWFWGIPLFDGTMSVGYVTPSQYASQSEQGLPDLFHAKVAESTELKRLMADARQVSAFRSARDWSYQCTKFHGPGWALVGDAAAFIDPLFSTGVALGTLAAQQLSRTLDVVLREPELESPALQLYEDGYRHFLESIISFVRYFYDGTRDLEYYYQRAQAIIDPEQRVSARRDFVTLISGLSGARPIFPLPLEELRTPSAA
ncbi:NAD(P)/FAD-dependent oxidoreductase [Actinomycetes bacterium KLBMP 9797]